ncbi:fam-m protein [Plasmodium malariae]|uniref:Fam-m protein n=1 Tax=Plasmodium malariae TaxID=5858 RepID=A0A1D3TDQ9_PLAMA|nr:fam-m protein [Plasmodium malariae]SCP03079.1 fam-m protein [Plasmodium malariae]
MKQKIKLHIIIKISMFLFLTWICHFGNNLSTFSKTLDKNFYLDRKLATRNYRSLVKYKQDYSNNECLKENFPNNGVNEKNDIYSNKKGTKIKSKQSNRSLLNKAQYYTEVVDYNNGMFDGKHFHFEKKLIKKKDYDNIIERKRRIRNISLKKIKFRSYSFGVAILFLFFLLGFGYPALHHYSVLEGVGEKLIELLSVFYDKLNKALKASEMCIILYSIVIVILSVIIIVAIYKILRNNEKYKIIKLMTE